MSRSRVPSLGLSLALPRSLSPAPSQPPTSVSSTAAPVAFPISTVDHSYSLTHSRAFHYSSRLSAASPAPPSYTASTPPASAANSSSQNNSTPSPSAGAPSGSSPASPPAAVSSDSDSSFADVYDSAADAVEYEVYKTLQDQRLLDAHLARKRAQARKIEQQKEKEAEEARKAAEARDLEQRRQRDRDRAERELREREQEAEKRRKAQQEKDRQLKAEQERIREAERKAREAEEEKKRLQKAEQERIRMENQRKIREQEEKIRAEKEREEEEKRAKEQREREQRDAQSSAESRKSAAEREALERKQREAEENEARKQKEEEIKRYEAEQKKKKELLEAAERARKSVEERPMRRARMAMTEQEKLREAEEIKARLMGLAKAKPIENKAAIEAQSERRERVDRSGDSFGSRLALALTSAVLVYTVYELVKQKYLDRPASEAIEMPALAIEDEHQKRKAAFSAADSTDPLANKRTNRKISLPNIEEEKKPEPIQEPEPVKQPEPEPEPAPEAEEEQHAAEALSSPSEDSQEPDELAVAGNEAALSGDAAESEDYVGLLRDAESVLEDLELGNALEALETLIWDDRMWQLQNFMREEGREIRRRARELLQDRLSDYLQHVQGLKGGLQVTLDPVQEPIKKFDSIAAGEAAVADLEHKLRQLKDYRQSTLERDIRDIEDRVEAEMRQSFSELRASHQPVYDQLYEELLKDHETEYRHHLRKFRRSIIEQEYHHVESEFQDHAAQFMSLILAQRQGELTNILSQYQALEASAASLEAEKARSDRLDKLDDVRARVNAYSKIFGLQERAMKDSQQFHSLTSAALALDSALHSQGGFQSEWAALRSFTEGDPIIQCAVESIPDRVVVNGVLSAKKLQESFDSVEKRCKDRAFEIETGTFSFINRAIGQFFSLLTFRDPQPMAGEDDTAKLSRAAAFVQQQNFPAARKELESLSERVRDPALPWIHAVRDRSIVEQALAIIRARVTTRSIALANAEQNKQ